MEDNQCIIELDRTKSWFPKGVSAFIDKKNGVNPRWKCTRGGQLLTRVIYKNYHNVEFEKGYQINHRCNNSLCINIDHLYLGTQQDNMKDRVLAGRTNKGKKLKKPGSHPIEKRIFKKLPIETIIEIKKLYKEKKFSQTELAKIYKVSQVRICKLLNNKDYDVLEKYED